MKRILFVCTLLLSYSVGGALVCQDRGQTKVSPAIGVAFGQSVAGKTCTFSIIGTWQVEGRTRTAKTYIYEFLPNGEIMIREHTAEVLPQEYEEIGHAKYELNSPEAPKRIEFTGIAMNNNTAIRRGKTSLMVVEYGDDSFVTEDPKTEGSNPMGQGANASALPHYRRPRRPTHWRRVRDSDVDNARRTRDQIRISWTATD